MQSDCGYSINERGTAHGTVSPLVASASQTPGANLTVPDGAEDASNSAGVVL